MLRISPILSLLLLLLCGPAPADPVADADCSQPQKAQRIINHCSSLKYQTAQERLNVVYHHTLAALADSGDRDGLKASQSAWAAYRDAQCRLEAPPNRRGSMWSTVYTGCARQLTEERIAQLEFYLNCTLRADESKCASK